MHFVDITMFYAPEGGGVSTYLDAKARWLARRTQVRHTILSPNIRGALQTPAALGIPSIALPGIDGFRMPVSVGAAARPLKECEPDLIEAGDVCQCAWAALRVKRQRKIPAVAFYHSDLLHLVERRFGKLIVDATRKYLSHTYSQFDMVMAPSMRMVQQLKMLGVADPVHQPLGVDTWTFCPQRRDPTLRQQLRLPPNTRLLVYAGRFTPEKNLSLLINAVKKLGKPYHLLLIGSGDALPGLRHATVIPFQRDPRQLAQLIASCDALVHPGDCETFGLVVLEAMACGLPVVGTTAGGVAELVDEQTGLLVQPNNLASLCEGIEALFERDMGQLRKNARSKAADFYDWDRIMPQLLQRYAGLLGMLQSHELEPDNSFAVR